MLLWHSAGCRHCRAPAIRAGPKLGGLTPLLEMRDWSKVMLISTSVISMTKSLGVQETCSHGQLGWSQSTQMLLLKKALLPSNFATFLRHRKLYLVTISDGSLCKTDGWKLTRAMLDL